MEVGNGIKLTTDSWHFADSVDNFEEHIAQSIPHCQEQRDFIGGLSRFFLHEGAVVYEIGVSTGALARAVLARIPRRDCRYVGLDAIPGMVDRAREKLKDDARFEVIVADACSFPFENAALVLSYYTLQFIPLPERIALVRKLYNSLREGGALIIYEKTMGGDARIQDMFMQMYFEFKARQGLDTGAILNKSYALQGVAMPISFDANRDLLLEAGFSTVEVVYRAYSFAGFLAIKEKQ
jgi:tRNA (cmo5U34)-methyltransferase